MSEQSPQNDNTAVSAAAELGAKLREAREKRGFSIGEVAERLKLPARQIEGLESGNYENMPELVFVRGFLRTYGRFLDLDENEVAAYMKGLQKNSSGNHLYFHYFRYENTASSYSDWDVWAWPFTQEGHRFDWAGRMTSRDGLRASGDAQVDVLGVPISISI